MVHLSYASPDRKWVLVLEMNPVWQPCRVVPLDGGSAGWQVGPKGQMHLGSLVARREMDVFRRRG